MENRLEKYGIIVKMVLVCLTGLWLVGEGCWSGYFTSERNSITGFYDPYMQPNFGGSELRFNEWRGRKEKLDADVVVIYREAMAKGDDYTAVEYFKDYLKLIELEDRYRINLAGAGIWGPIHQLCNLRDGRRVQVDRWVQTDKDKAFIASAQEIIEKRSGLADHRPTDWFGVGWWFVYAYLKIMLMFFLFYLIRFEEESYRLSLRSELCLCPWRFVLRVLFWPKWCLAYPLHEDTAEVVRYVRLKAQYLRYKPFGYQLSKREDAWLRERAKSLDYQTALENLWAQFGPQAIRHSVVAAYLSLFLGVVFQPAIALAGHYLPKAYDHFYSSNDVVISCTVKVDHEEDHETGLPRVDDDDSGGQAAVLPARLEVRETLNMVGLVQPEPVFKLPGFSLEIFRVPIYWLFGRVVLESIS